MLALFAVAAHAQIDPRCQGLEKPGDYDEQAQQDFLQNYVALASAFSPIHGPVPAEGGHGALGVDLNVIPPLGCSHRLVLDYTKTEDTNKSPLLPRPRLVFALPTVGRTTIYGGLAYLPPVKLLGITNVILSAEIGVGARLGETVQLGGRFHATSHKTVGEIATPFEEGGQAFDDLYLASTFGFDAMFGLDFAPVVPYVAVGFLDASTFFFIGDDGIVANNFHPYAGLAGSVGADALFGDHYRVGAEFYAAPGGYSQPAKDTAAEPVTPASRYGRLYTGKLRLAYEF